jgi:hypothetical protein
VPLLFTVNAWSVVFAVVSTINNMSVVPEPTLSAAMEHREAKHPHDVQRRQARLQQRRKEQEKKHEEEAELWASGLPHKNKVMLRRMVQKRTKAHIALEISKATKTAIKRYKKSKEFKAKIHKIVQKVIKQQQIHETNKSLERSFDRLASLRGQSDKADLSKQFRYMLKHWKGQLLFAACRNSTRYG